VSRRLTRWLAYLLTVGATVLALGIADPAWAADEPTSLTIAGQGLSDPIELRQAAQPELFNRLLHQITWMAAATGAPARPDPATLGPKYTLTLLTSGKPTQTYDVYPHAKGGPKAFRPATQPQGAAPEAWFYVSMSVPELLQAAGVPAADESTIGLQYQDPAGYVPAAVNTDNRPLVNLRQIVDGQRRTLLAWAGSALAVLALVVLAARRSRRRYAT